MVEQAKKADQTALKQLHDLYLRRTDAINNWDLVDVSCRDIVGRYLQNKPRHPYQLARSADLWERRIAMVSTWQFIREGDLDDTFAIAVAIAERHARSHAQGGWLDVT